MRRRSIKLDGHIMERKGLSCLSIKNNRVFIDADNVFWGIAPANQDSDILIPRGVLSLYEKAKNKCDQEMEDFRFSSGLTAIYIDPTDLCNADCPYCYVPAKIRKHGRSMTAEELDFVLTKIKKYFRKSKKKPVIIFHASEPLLVKEIMFSAIEKFKEYFYFGIQTNGILLEDKDIEFIKKLKIGVGISLDASDAAINNRLRFSVTGRGNYDRAIRAIEQFNGYNGLNIITTITRFNVTNLPELVKFLHKKKVPCILINPVRLTQKASRALKPDEGLMTEYFLKAVGTAVELSKNSGRRIIIGNFANIILGIIAPMARRLMCDISPCGGGRCFLTITASGKMIPCGEFIGLKRFSGGNIFKTSIEQAMQSRPFKKIRDRFVEKISECNVCIFRNICGAPCPAELYALNDMYKKAVFCEFYKEIIKYAFSLIAKREEKYCLREEGLNNLKHEYQIGGL